LKSIRDEIADIVFLDPPFNLGKKYGSRGARSDRKAEKDYIAFIHEVLQSSVRVLRPGETLYLYYIPQWVLRFGNFLDKQMLFRHWIAVSMKNGFARGNFLYPAHYSLLYLSKGNPFRATIRSPVAWMAGMREIDYLMKNIIFIISHEKYVMKTIIMQRKSCGSL
jgi:site-specific DNA-methyltransferase (adenine-specific)